MTDARTSSVSVKIASKEGLTDIERVRLALAMADAGYAWEIEIEYVEALLMAYDDLRTVAQQALTRDDIAKIIADQTCAGWADDKVLGIDKAADMIVLALSSTQRAEPNIGTYIDDNTDDGR